MPLSHSNPYLILLVGKDSMHLSTAIVSDKKIKKDKATPVQALRVPGCWSSKISWQLVHEGGKVVSCTHRPSLPPRKYS